jgi:hypothetical protein
MKKIIISEEKLTSLKNFMDEKLPDYVYQSVKTHNTSLGESPCFPPSSDYDFDYKLLKQRYSELIENMKEYELPLDDIEAENLLYKLTTKAMSIERGIRPHLNKLVENVINKLFAVPQETINLTCELTDNVTPQKSIRVIPEDGSDNDEYTFNDVDEISQVNDIVKQRRFINSLIQGYSVIESENDENYADFFISHGLENLLDLYAKINTLNDYLIFTKEEKIDKKNPTLVSYVEVHLGHGDNKTVIKSQGIIFPYLLKETIRGFMELFSSHGLPEDNHKAQAIIKRSDFTMAEPWDIRLGVPLWNKMFGKYHILSNMIPYFFAQYCSEEKDTFFDITKNILANTRKGKEYLLSSTENIEHDMQYQEFLDSISQKNVDNSLISDGYMTADELDSYTISEEGNIEENQENEYNDSYHLSPLKNHLTNDDGMENVKEFYDNAGMFVDNYFKYYVDAKDREKLNSGSLDFEETIGILKKYPEVLKAFIEKCNRLAIERNVTNTLLDYNRNVDINKEWLIHFTPVPADIALNGFVKGTSDYTDLGITHGSFKREEGYNFAFTADNANEEYARYYCGDNTDNWGAVMFKANGVEAYHGGDNQYQVMFWGPSARDIVPIYYGDISYDINMDYEDDYYDTRGSAEDCWYVMDDRSQQIYYSNESLEAVIEWVENNYFQYKNRLNNYTHAKSDYVKKKMNNNQ